MTISTYAELQTAVSRWVNQTNLTAMVPDFIALGESRLYRELRVKAMETALSATITAGAVAVPSGYVEMKHARLSGQGPLVRKTDEWIYATYPERSANGVPCFFAREASNFIFGPYPDDGYTMEGTYYKRLDALSDSNTSNWLTTDCPDLILFAALYEAADYMADDEQLMKWERKYTIARDAVQRESDREAFSGSPISMTAR